MSINELSRVFLSHDNIQGKDLKTSKKSEIQKGEKDESQNKRV